MINLYVFNETRRGAVYGAGTYVREQTAVLKGSDINVCVVNIASDKSQILTEEIDGIKYWHIPKLILQQRTIDDQKIDELYYCNIVHLFQIHIKDKNNLMFHLNYNQCKGLVEELKNVFDYRIIAVIYLIYWRLKIYYNLQRLRNIINEEHLDSFGGNLKKSFEEDKSCYSKMDRIVCLSNYMQEILCRDYGLYITKISVIPNGLPDVSNPTVDIKLLTGKCYIPPREKNIFFAGCIDDAKGVGYLIKAFCEI
jgi:glycosyltransferase involved in cell wall biosynthesis